LKVKGTETFCAILVGADERRRPDLGIFDTLDQHSNTTVAGNKSDVDTHEVSDWYGKISKREVTKAEGVALARKLSMEAGHEVPFIETSAKFNTNVTTAFAGISLDHGSSH
jgi:hypothetical protein